MLRFRLITILVVLGFLFLSTLPNAHAQMMINNGNPSISVDQTQIQQQQQEEAQGKQFFDQLQNQQITCAKLNDSDFEKIGEYAMSQMFGNNTQAHIAMNQRIQQMRGVQGEEQMHSQIGKSVTGCTTWSSQNSTPKGGVSSMMGFGNYGYTGMLGTNGSFGWFGVFAFIGWIVVFIDLVLVGIWLWKQIKKK